jgi:hypothetical protein
MRSKANLFLLAVICGFICSAAAQEPTVAFPKNYSVAFENETVEVIRVHYGPHERIGVHDHSRFPTIYVYLSDSGAVRFEHDEKPPFSLTRPPTTMGAFRVSPGRVERHVVENLGDLSSDLLRVELKRVPLGSLKPFRGKAPRSLAQDSQVVEFRSPEFTIQRIVCGTGSGCNGLASSSPSLLIALSPLKVEEKGGQQNRLMRDGDVAWEPAERSISVSLGSGASAHLLRISFTSEVVP